MDVGIALGGLLEDLDGGFERAVDEEFAGPVEEVAFAGIDVRGGFVFVGGGYELTVFFFDLAEEVVEFGGGLLFQEVR